LKTKVLWIRGEYLRQILEGRKTVEVRVAYSNLARLQPGDRLLLNDRYAYIIRRIGRYPDFAALLAAENLGAITPDLPVEDLLLALRSIYPPDKESMGVVALEIEPESLSRSAQGPGN
jgi:ASC-1-like (ASCH) protein